MPELLTPWLLFYMDTYWYRRKSEEDQACSTTHLSSLATCSIVLAPVTWQTYMNIVTHSWSRNSEYSSSPTFTGLPPYYDTVSPCLYSTESDGRMKLTCGIKTLSPGATLGAILFPSLSSPPGPTASTFASLSSFTLLSGRKIPPAVFVSALILWTRIRSRRGASDLMDLRAVV